MCDVDLSNIVYRGLGVPFRPWLFINILKASIKYRLRQYHLFFDIRYELAMDLTPSATDGTRSSVYEEKMTSLSPHSLVCRDNALIPPESYVLDIGCATGYVCQSLSRQKNCTTEGIDRLNADQFSGGRNSTYHKIDLDGDWEPLNRVIEASPCDVVLLLDVIEHLTQPELFLINLYKRRFKKNPKFLISTGNVAFIVIRLMLLAGFFNYGKKGILDITHKRLFTSRNFKNLMEQTGFITKRMTYFPLPFKALGWPSPLAGLLEQLNVLLIKISPSLFSYQMMVEAIHLPSTSDWTDVNPT
jgi:2-polyprenyl-3-methyl-5-hydroxy-6-metoxy-1,4-benzoquinol methylase